MRLGNYRHAIGPELNREMLIMCDRLLCAALLLVLASGAEAGNRHEPPRYRLERLEGIGGFPTEINRHGTITGQGFIPPTGPFNVPFVWTRKRSFILTEDDQTIPVIGNAVNDKGQVAGFLVALEPRRNVGFVWTRGQFVEIGDLPGGNTFSSAEDINQSGQVAGYSESAQGTECILWEHGNLMSIGDLPGSNVDCVAQAINRSGAIVGFGSTDQGFRGFLWREGTMTELPAPPEAAFVTPVDINRSGIVIGNWSFEFDFGGAIVWSNDGATMTLLPGLQGLVPTVRGMNDRGDIVGALIDNPNAQRAILWHNGVPTLLDDLIADDDPLKACTRLEVAGAINNRGEIAASGANTCVAPVSNTSVFRLVPVKRP